MRLSVREVFDLAQRCFVAADFPHGAAEANARAIWWTEAYRGEGIETLHDLLEVLPELDRSRVTRADSGSSAVTLDAGGQPGIVSSTPALDLACSRADRDGIGLVYGDVAATDPSLPTMGHLAHRGAKRGLLTVVLVTDDDGNSTTIVGTPGEPCPLVALTSLPEPSASYRKLQRLRAADLSGLDQGPLTQAFARGPAGLDRSTSNAGLLSRLLDDATKPLRRANEGAERGYVVVCLDPHHPQQSERLGGVVREFVREDGPVSLTVFEPADVGERVSRLIESGVEVEGHVWRDIFECSSDVLAPPFEGSEKGAGFDINE